MQLCRGGEGWGFTAYQNKARAGDGEDRGEGNHLEAWVAQKRTRQQSSARPGYYDRGSGALLLPRCRVNHSLPHHTSRGT
eukprot:3503695-Rhodomonas_salina.1